MITVSLVDRGKIVVAVFFDLEIRRVLTTPTRPSLIVTQPPVALCSAFHS